MRIPLTRIAPHTLDVQTHSLVSKLITLDSTNPPTYAFGTLLLLGSQWLDVDFHSWKSLLS